MNGAIKPGTNKGALLWGLLSISRFELNTVPNSYKGINTEESFQRGLLALLEHN